MKKIKGLPDWFLAYSKGRYIREKNRKHMQWWDPWDRYIYGLYGMLCVVFIGVLIPIGLVLNIKSGFFLYTLIPLLILIDYFFTKKFKARLMDWFSRSDTQVWSIKSVRVLEICAYLIGILLMLLTIVISHWSDFF